jgi:prepilin-type N-terminal cleavage/methylation domain-containing protein
MKSGKWQLTNDELAAFGVPRLRGRTAGHRLKAELQTAFTLLELLVVISILGILAALTVPAFKTIGKANATASASRQLLDGVARARQLAMSQRTTVYMVFVPTNFWDTFGKSSLNNIWLNSNLMTPALKTAATNLCDEQLSGYNFVAFGAMGDQPGEHAWHYLAPWQTLPEGSFIALQKFAGTNTIMDPITGVSYPIAPFDYTNNIPFPTETSPSGVSLPYIAFDYRGQLVSGSTEYVPLAQGSVLPATDPNTKTLQFGPGPNYAPDVLEVPPGNSTNISYRIVDVDPLTGRAVLLYHKMQ